MLERTKGEISQQSSLLQTTPKQRFKVGFLTRGNNELPHNRLVIPYGSTEAFKSPAISCMH